MAKVIRPRVISRVVPFRHGEVESAASILSCLPGLTLERRDALAEPWN